MILSSSVSGSTQEARSAGNLNPEESHLLFINDQLFLMHTYTHTHTLFKKNGNALLSMKTVGLSLKDVCAPAYHL